MRRPSPIVGPELLGVSMREVAKTVAVSYRSGVLGRVFAWVFDKQQSLQRTLA
jgi:hypothetical protein